MSALTISETVQRFRTLYDLNRAPDDTQASFHCGRTDNLERHKADCQILTYLATTQCSSNEIASKLLDKLQEAGFTIDASAPDSPEAVFVYLYKDKVNN